MARPEFIRGTRSRAPYGYSREGKPNQRPETNLLAWILTIIVLSAVAIVAWLFPAYVFRNPHIAFNYELLRKIGKLEDLEVFSAAKPPPQREREFFTARQIFDQESGRSEEKLAVINDLQKRLYVQNFKYGDMLGYIFGRFEVIGSRVLGPDDVFPGLALLAKSNEFPNTVLEYLVPIEGEFADPYKEGQSLDLVIEKGRDLCAILHLSHLPQDRICVTALPLTYSSRPISKGQDLEVAVPTRLNLKADWPVFSHGETSG